MRDSPIGTASRHGSAANSPPSGSSVETSRAVGFTHLPPRLSCAQEREDRDSGAVNAYLGLSHLTDELYRSLLLEHGSNRTSLDHRDLPTPPWQRHPPQRTRRRGREPITREAIVEAALHLLGSDGLDELSMRRLADELDSGPASLYWHVGSKDGLLELLFDRVIGEVEMPAPEPDRWQEQLVDGLAQRVYAQAVASKPPRRR